MEGKYNDEMLMRLIPGIVKGREGIAIRKQLAGQSPSGEGLGTGNGCER
jgi:hypothetical protein